MKVHIKHTLAKMKGKGKSGSVKSWNTRDVKRSPKMIEKEKRAKKNKNHERYNIRTMSSSPVEEYQWVPFPEDGHADSFDGVWEPSRIEETLDFQGVLYV